MTPQQQQMLQDVYDWVQARKQQQLAFPLDEVSKEIIAIQPSRAGSTSLTQGLAGVDSRGDSFNITVPKAYVGTEVVVINGRAREIPYIA